MVKKTEYDTKINEIENKFTTYHDYEKYITVQKFNKLTSDNFAARLAQANLASKSDIGNFFKKTDFGDKLININFFFKQNKNFLFKNELNELSKKVEAISTKGLTKNLINGYRLLNVAKYSSELFQNYLVFIPAKNNI